MGLKKRSKVSAEFNMSSLTDIIFLLLIFFMLTSSVVSPNLNLKLPGRSDSPDVSANRKLDDVRIDNNGRFYFNGKRTSVEALESTLSAKAGGNYAMFISPDRKAPIEGVVAVMDLANRLRINGVLAAED
jgi:biopolymer transport protein ExbD